MKYKNSFRKLSKSFLKHPTKNRTKERSCCLKQSAQSLASAAKHIFLFQIWILVNPRKTRNMLYKGYNTQKAGVRTSKWAICVCFLWYGFLWQKKRKLHALFGLIKFLCDCLLQEKWLNFFKPINIEKEFIQAIFGCYLQLNNNNPRPLQNWIHSDIIKFSLWFKAFPFKNSFFPKTLRKNKKINFLNAWRNINNKF